MISFIHKYSGDRPKRISLGVLLLASLLWISFYSDSMAQSVIPVTNPDLVPACGIDVALVLDASDSIDNGDDVQTSLQQQVRDATQSFVGAMSNTGANVAIVEFATFADTPISYTPVTQTTIDNIFDPYINGTSGGDGYHDGRLGDCTNWDDAFRQVNALPHKADLVVFMTDGRPNNVHGSSVCKSPLATALDAAANQANITKSGPDGSHIFAIGIDETIIPVSNLQSVTDIPSLHYNTFNFAVADYVIGTSESLVNDFKNIASELCAQSLTVTKLVDDADGNGYQPDSGWTFTGSIDAGPEGFTWVAPASASGTSASVTTGSNGTASFQWKDQVASTNTIAVQEQNQAGYSFVNAQCTVHTSDNPTPQPLSIQTGSGSFTAQLQPEQIATCTVRNAKTAISLQKSVSPAQLPESGGQATYTYNVTNSGGLPLTLTSLTDNKLGNLDGQGTCAISGGAPVVIAAGASYSCQVATSVSGDAGTSLTNLATIQATTGSAIVSATDNATVAFTDVLPTAQVQLSANPTSLLEPGGTFSMTVTAENTSSAEALTLSSLTHQGLGDVSAIGGSIVSTSCSLPQILQPSSQAGSDYECTYVFTLAGEPGIYLQEVSGSLTDNENNAVTPTAQQQLTILDALPAVAVTKSASPLQLPEPGGIVSFTVSIENQSAVEAFTITSLQDDPFGDITTTSASLNSTTCSVPVTLAPAGQNGDSYTCEFSINLIGNPGDYTDTVTVAGADNEDNQLATDADATVTLEDLPSSIQIVVAAGDAVVLEPSAEVTYDVTILNTSLVDTVTITQVVDSLLGDISAGCAVPLPVELPVGGSLSCQFSEIVSGQPSDQVTHNVVAFGYDDDGLNVTDTDQEEVEIADVPSAINVSLDADVSEVMEPGDDVSFTVTIKNESLADTVEIISVLDDQFGDVGASCASTVPFSLTPGETATCMFTQLISGVTGDSHINVVTVAGTDDDGQAVSDSDQEEVDIDNVPSSIKVIESVTPTGLFEPGGTVTFTAQVINSSAVDMVIIQQIALTSSAQTEDIASDCDRALPATLAPTEVINCVVVREIIGTADTPYVNQISANGVDDDGFSVQDFDQESITIFDLPASLRTEVGAAQTTVSEPGGNVDFDVVVRNTSAVDIVTVNEVVSNQGGDISASCTPALPTDLTPGDEISCGYTHLVSGPVGSLQQHEVVASGQDKQGRQVADSAQDEVAIVDLASVIEVSQRGLPTSVTEPGQDVSFSISIINKSVVDAVTIETVVDDAQADIGPFCMSPLPVTLAPGELLLCAYDRFITGIPGSTTTTTVSVTATDDDGQGVAASDELDVDINDILPSVSVVQIADLAGVPESGDFVTFNVIATNNSLVEPATLTALNDSVVGDLNGLGDCILPQTLSPNGGTYICSYTLFVDGNATQTRSSSLTATIIDDDGNTNSHEDNESVFLVDIKPDIRITLTPTPTAILESGDLVTYTASIINVGPEDVSLTWLSTVQTRGLAPDSAVVASASADAQGPNGGTPNDECGALGMLAANGGQFTCTFTTFRAGPAGSDHRTEVIVLAQDDDGNLLHFAANALIRFTPAIPNVQATKVDTLVSDLVPALSNPGDVTPGDTIGYTITVTNTGTGTATNVNIQDTLDQATTLVVGSVETSQGTVVEGNTTGDANIHVRLPELAPGETTTVSFLVTVNPGTGVTILRNQAVVTIDSATTVDGATAIPTIDPDGQGDDGVTRTPVQPVPTSLAENPEPQSPTDDRFTIFVPILR